MDRYFEAGVQREQAIGNFSDRVTFVDAGPNRLKQLRAIDTELSSALYTTTTVLAAVPLSAIIAERLDKISSIPAYNGGQSGVVWLAAQPVEGLSDRIRSIVRPVSGINGEHWVPQKGGGS
jgi:hypothetical protein